MIAKFDIAKALYDQAKIIADANNIKIVASGEGYEPNPEESYIEEYSLFGDDDSIGIADNSKDILFGVYQLNVLTPKILQGSRWLGLGLIDAFQQSFTKGLELTFNGQMVRIKNASAYPMDQNETHLIHVLSVNYSVIN